MIGKIISHYQGAKHSESEMQKEGRIQSENASPVEEWKLDTGYNR